MWFVPFANLVLPKNATDDAWRAGERDAVVPAFVHFWWAAWIVSSLFGNAVGRIYADADTLQEFRTADYVDIAFSVLSIVAALLAIRVVQSVTVRQEPLVQRLASPA
jgi:uncharacterized membrane protein (UPF0136 family)